MNLSVRLLNLTTSIILYSADVIAVFNPTYSDNVAAENVNQALKRSLFIL